MADPKPKKTPAERLAKQLKTEGGNCGPEAKEFRRKLRTIVPLCKYPDDISDWISARYELGLINDISVQRIANEILRLIELVEAERFEKASPKQPTLDAEERLRLINQREAEARNNVRPVGCIITPSIQARMARGFDQMLDEVIASVRRGAP